MARLTIFTLLFTLFAALLAVQAAPLKRRALLRATEFTDFTELDYADFQISDGTAGDAKEKAEAVFVTPFKGIDLATVSSTVLKAVQNMREAAEAAETDKFNPAIEAADGTEADALGVGKIQNKVLKLVGEVQALNIKIAQAKASGDDTSDLESDLAAEQKKLDKNIATDVASKGADSQSVV